MVRGEVEATSRDFCAKKNQQECDDSALCTYCASNSTCWPVVDLENPCLELVVRAATFGAKTGTDVASKLVETGMWVSSQCQAHNTSDACMGGLGIFCSWCNATESCHNKGSLANYCLREELKIIAADALTEAAKEARKMARAKWASLQQDCAKLDENETACGEAAACLWCGETEGTTYNKCHFVGDVSNNTCLMNDLKPFIDAGGRIKALADVVGSKLSQGWTNLQTWGSGICGKYTGSKESCDSDQKCYWCEDANDCFVMGSVNSPCGVAKKSMAAVTQKWNELWGSGGTCSSDKMTARDMLRQGVEFAASNLNKACTAYVDSEVHASRSLAALQKDLASAAEAASEAASMQVAKVKQAILDVSEALKEDGIQANALKAFDASNNCTTEVDGAVSNVVPSLLLVMVPLISATQF
eukprot:TRINITY_DN39338_c0_g1_i1.p1 TRINITY_DN39338_c0_g1~~TRINITY_DN39338_c0_g1_i1.p1  ORF type:complete len:488 (-),score=105.19 TRINITY_DN39338_c0_g1_i1:105-1352(-)